MPKAIESIKEPYFKDDVLRDRIAETYFYHKNHPKGHKRKIKANLKNLRALLPALSLSFVLAFFLILIFIFFNGRYTLFLKEKVVNAKVIKLFEGGRINRDIIRNIEFRGHAKGKSGLSNKLIVLNNPEKYNWADLSLNFKFPMDFSKRKLYLSLRGKIGGERINLILRDVNNKTFRLSGISLGSNWLTETVSFDNTVKEIDLSRVTHLRVEGDYIGEFVKETGPFTNFTIYISNIRLVKEG